MANTTFDKTDRYSAVQSAANTAVDDISNAASRVQETANEQFDKLSASIRDKPLQSAAIAAGLGFLFAVVARR